MATFAIALGIFLLLGESNASIQDHCTDISYWGEISYKTTTKQCCDTKLKQVCTSKSDQVCQDVLELQCEVVAWGECKSKPTSTRSTKCDVKYNEFAHQNCKEIAISVKHKKKVPECKKITKNNCVTDWDVDADGNKVWAGTETCTPVSWEECEIVEKTVEFPTAQTECDVDSHIKWTEFVDVDTNVVGLESKCEVKKAENCKHVVANKCATVVWKECKMEPWKECLAKTIHTPNQEKIHQKKCLTAPPGYDGVEMLSCDQEYLLDGTQMKKLEFILKPLADEDEACKFTINIADGFHGLVNCLTTGKGSVKINSRETKTYNGTGPIRIEWLAEGKDRMAGKMYCDIGMVELIQEIKLKGKNGIEATVEDIIEAFGLDFETINIPIEELAENLEDSKKRVLELNMNPDRSWTASIGKLSIFTLDYVIETMTGLIEVSEDQLSAEAGRKRKKRENIREQSVRMEQELLAPLRDKEKPESVDLVERGAVSSVKNQGSCNSCAAFAATSAVETCVYNANGNVLYGDLSEQNLLDCAFGYYGNRGCRGGNPSSYFRFLKEKGGMLADEQDYGYHAEDGDCLLINAKNTGALVTDFYSSNKVTEEDVKALVAEGYQVVTNIKVADDHKHYNGPGIFESDQCWSSEDPIAHVVTIVGYGTENGVPYWKIKNSWGQDWGNKGFKKIVRGKKHCKILDRVWVPKCSAGSPIPVSETAPYEPPIATFGAGCPVAVLDVSTANAINNNLIGGVTVILSKDGKVERRTTDKSGKVRFNSPHVHGQVVLTAERDGFTMAPVHITVGAEECQKTIKLSLSPEYIGAARVVFVVVLNWGPLPKDLDLHVIQLKDGKEVCHGFYNNQNCGGFTLDVDNRLGGDNGTEIVTFSKLEAGSEYLVFVHHSKLSLAESQARVTFYRDGYKPTEMSVPTQGKDKSRRYWMVACFNSDGEFVGSNRNQLMSSEPTECG